LQNGKWQMAATARNGPNNGESSGYRLSGYILLTLLRLHDTGESRAAAYRDRRLHAGGISSLQARTSCLHAHAICPCGITIGKASASLLFILLLEFSGVQVLK
jgi:hypothetical protein